MIKIDVKSHPTISKLTGIFNFLQVLVLDLCQCNLVPSISIILEMWTQKNAIKSILQHECQTRATRVRHEWDTSDTSVTRVLLERHEWKFFDFHNNTSENIFSHPYSSYMANERLHKERNNFIRRTTFWKCIFPMPICIWKVHLKDWTL